MVQQMSSFVMIESHFGSALYKRKKSLNLISEDVLLIGEALWCVHGKVTEEKFQWSSVPNETVTTLLEKCTAVPVDKNST